MLGFIGSIDFIVFTCPMWSPPKLTKPAHTFIIYLFIIRNYVHYYYCYLYRVKYT